MIFFYKFCLVVLLISFSGFANESVDSNVSKQCPEEQSFSGLLRAAEQSESVSEKMLTKIANSDLNNNISQYVQKYGIDLQKYSNTHQGSLIPVSIIFFALFFGLLILMLFIVLITKKVAKLMEK